MQRDQYISRAEKMRRELKVLKDQKSELLDGKSKRSPSPKTKEFVKENDKLQVNNFIHGIEILLFKHITLTHMILCVPIPLNYCLNAQGHMIF